MNNASERRNQAYLALLNHGLLMLRNYTSRGSVELCRIEAEHLQKIPTLIGEANEARHLFYLDATRGRYLAELRKLGAHEHLETALSWYREAWRLLADAAGVKLSEGKP